MIPLDSYPYQIHPRVQRLVEVYQELGYNAFEHFAKDINYDEMETFCYLSGKKDPTEDFLKKVVQRFTHINLNWLLSGILPKYTTPIYQEEPTVFSKKDEEIAHLYSQLSQAHQEIALLRRKCYELEQKLKLRP